MLRRVAVALVHLVMLAGCTSAAEPAAAPAPADAAMFVSQDGLVAAPRPPGDGWECIEQTADDPGQEVTLIKCRHTDRERFFFLMAKDYAVPAGQVRSIEELATAVFPATYQKLFQSHAITEARATTHAGAPAYDSWIEAVHATMGPIRKRERVIVRGTHVFVISAEGTPEAYDGEAAATEAWFAGARFKNLQ